MPQSKKVVFITSPPHPSVRDMHKLATAAGLADYSVKQIDAPVGRLSLEDIRKAAKGLPALVANADVVVSCGEGARRACVIAKVQGHVSIPHPATFEMRGEGVVEYAIAQIKQEVERVV